MNGRRRTYRARGASYLSEEPSPFKQVDDPFAPPPPKRRLGGSIVGASRHPLVGLRGSRGWKGPRRGGLV